MRAALHLLACIVVLASAPDAALQPAPQAPARPAVVESLRPGHPRLLVADEDLDRVRALLRSDSRLRGWRDDLQRQAAAMLDEPPVTRRLVGPRLLAQSRAALRRISTLAGLYRLDGDPRKLARARDEMLAAADFVDWNPQHFLDVAEMTAALAIGYDWLHADLAASDRERIRDAIVGKGLEPGVTAIERRAWWAVEGRNNWTQVCLGGLALGALAVADEAPGPAARVLEAVRGEGMARRLRLYAPDGGDEEGPGYWDYATTYTAYLLAALDTALGDDFGLSRADGLASTGLFRMHAIGPSGLQFNYADARERPGPAPQMFWLAGKYDRPEYAAHERAWLSRAGAAPDIMHLLWAPGASSREAAAPPAAARFAGVDVAFLRGDWRDPQATWVGLKGGSNAASHAHLDLGAFVVDALGERWAVDLGPDDYDLPGYFGPSRWTYFRLRTESHNTLLVGGGNQRLDARAPIVGFSGDAYRAYAVVDLTAAYAPELSRARRGVALIDGRDVLIQDELDGAAGADVVWQMFTRAQVTLEGRTAVLRQNGRVMTLRVIEPATALLRTGRADAPPPQAAQPEVTGLRILLAERRPRARIVVWLSTGDRQAPAVIPLDDWRP